jgi:hypothetical protein
MKTLVITEITDTDNQRRQIRDAERVELHTENQIIVIKDRNAPMAQPNEKS